MKKMYLIVLFVFSTVVSFAQSSQFLITGNYEAEPLKLFIEEVERKYEVEFFYDDNAINNILVTAEFNKTPLKECLEFIFDEKLMNFYVSGNSQFIIYPRIALKSLFLAKDAQNEEVII